MTTTCTSTTTLPCDVYRSSKQEFLYLFVHSSEGLTRVPQALLDKFGQAEVTMSLELSADRKLAREDVSKVISNIIENGYHLQLPPANKNFLE